MRISLRLTQGMKHQLKKKNAALIRFLLRLQEIS